MLVLLHTTYSLFPKLKGEHGFQLKGQGFFVGVFFFFQISVMSEVSDAIFWVTFFKCYGNFIQSLTLIKLLSIRSAIRK